jgi:hypothetical protein
MDTHIYIHTGSFFISGQKARIEHHRYLPYLGEYCPFHHHRQPVLVGQKHCRRIQCLHHIHNHLPCSSILDTFHPRSSCVYIHISGRCLLRLSLPIFHLDLSKVVQVIKNLCLSFGVVLLSSLHAKFYQS